jgi:hypothetical protein
MIVLLGFAFLVIYVALREQWRLGNPFVTDPRPDRTLPWPKC